jgi:predicted nucleic acid-binding protein
VNYLLDTNVVSEWTKLRPDPNVVRWLANVDEDRVFLSVMTVAELQRGVALLPAGSKRDRLNTWINVDVLTRFDGRVLDVTADVALQWGTLCAEAQRKGHAMGAIDAFFAATAAVHGLTLVTRNASDFEAIGVALLNPWTERA